MVVENDALFDCIISAHYLFDFLSHAQVVYGYWIIAVRQIRNAYGHCSVELLMVHIPGLIC